MADFLEMGLTCPKIKIKSLEAVRQSAKLLAVACCAAGRCAVNFFHPSPPSASEKKTKTSFDQTHIKRLT